MSEAELCMFVGCYLPGKKPSKGKWWKVRNGVWLPWLEVFETNGGMSMNQHGLVGRIMGYLKKMKMEENFSKLDLGINHF